MSTLPTPIEVFYSYADADECLCIELDKHLSQLRRDGLIVAFHKRLITAGQDWTKTLDAHLNTASVILMLVSSDFLASDYCYTQQLAHTTACTPKILSVRLVGREGLKASYFGKRKPENLSIAMEIDSCTISGECATILHEPLRKPQQTFGV